MTEPVEALTKVTQVEEFADSPHANAKMKVFRYRTPKTDKSRAFVPMVRSDIMFAMVQVLKEGGERQLHSHTALDGFWFVLKGSAKFYGENDVELATLGEHDGIFIPRNLLYWFESVGEETLELLQVEAIDKTVPNIYNVPDPHPVGVADVFGPEGDVIGKGLRLE